MWSFFSRALSVVVSALWVWGGCGVFVLLRNRPALSSREASASAGAGRSHTHAKPGHLTKQVGVLLAASVAVTAASEVVVLTDANFEHLTQAATGATTGDWLVAFKAPWCVVVIFCRRPYMGQSIHK